MLQEEIEDRELTSTNQEKSEQKKNKEIGEFECKTLGELGHPDIVGRYIWLSFVFHVNIFQ